MSTGLSSLRLCGVRVDPVSVDAAARTIIRAAMDARPLAVHLCNAHVLSLAYRELSYAELLNRGDLNVPDGMPVAWVGRRMGLASMVRVSGTDLFRTTVGLGRDENIRHYIYGSTTQVADRLAATLRREFVDVDIVGVESPPFRSLSVSEESLLVGRIRASRAQIVWVGLGTPKQDVLVDRLRMKADAVFIPVGAAFDFIAGTKQRAPDWMQRAGLEWMHRLYAEPGRLWRRYLVGNLVFLWAVARNHAVEERQPEP